MAFGAMVQELLVRLKYEAQGAQQVEQSASSLAKVEQHAGAAGLRLSGLANAAKGVGGAMDHASKQIGGLLTSQIALLGGATGLALGFKTVVESAQTFDQQMELLRTQAGASQAEVDSMKKALLDLGPAVGTSATDLAAGLYHIESAGMSGAQALEILKVAAEGAKVGNADLESVTNALIATVTSGVGGIKDMTQGMGVLNAIVGSGNMRMQDLADAMSTGILSSARSFGVSIQSVGAALADMTNQGVPAQDAATRLRMTLSLLGAPTSKAATELKGIGISSSALANAMRSPDGILAAVALLNEHIKKSGLSATETSQLISHAFGGGRSSSAILTLLGSQEKLAKIQDQINKGAGAFGDAWQATSQEADMSFARLQASLSTLSIEIGAALLPPLADMADQVSKYLSDPSNRESIVGGFKSMLTIAGQVGDAILTIGHAMANVWGMIPGPMQQLLIGGFVANKASSWLFGTSLTSVGRNLLSSLVGSTPLARVPGVGALAGAGVPHVWVDNMPANLGGGGPNIVPAGLPEAVTGFAIPSLGVLTAEVLTILGMYYAPQTIFRQSSGRGSLTTTTAAGTIKETGIGGTDYFSGFMPGFTQMALQAGATAGAATSVRAYGEHAADRIVAANNRANAIIGAGLTQGHRDMDKLNGTLVTVIGGKLDHLTEAQKSANLKLFGESHKITGKVPSEGDWLRAQLAAASSHANPERARLESQLATAQKELTAALKAIKPSRGAEGLQWFGGAATGDAARIAELRKTIADLTAQLKKTTDTPGRKLTQADLTVADAMTKALTQNLQHVESAVKDKKDLVSGLANIATLQRAARIAQSQGLTTLARGFSSDAQKLQAAVAAAQDTSRHVDSLKSHLDAITTAVQNIRFPAALVAAVNSGATSSSRERQVLGSLTVTTSERSNVIAHTRVGRWTPIRSSAI